MKVCINSAYSSDRDLGFFVPQGSCAGPVLYNIYAGTLGQRVDQCPSTILGYADDHSVYDFFKAGNIEAEMNTVHELEACLDIVCDWMRENRLKMNDSKTEVIYFGNQVQLDKCVTDSLNVGDETVQGSDSIKYLGVTLDCNLSLYAHITNKCKVACFNMYRIRKIRRHLSLDSCKVLMQSLVISHLDYANGIYIGLPQRSIDLMQRVQNMAAKVTLKS